MQLIFCLSITTKSWEIIGQNQNNEKHIKEQLICCQVNLISSNWKELLLKYQ